jgi:hypothetical protein
VVSAALLRVQSLTHDPDLRPATRTLLAAVTRDAGAGADHASRPWLDYALALAEVAGWSGAERERRTLAATPRPVAPERARPPAAAPHRAAARAASSRTPVDWALATLRSEPLLSPLDLSKR